MAVELYNTSTIPTFCQNDGFLKAKHPHIPVIHGETWLSSLIRKPTVFLLLLGEAVDRTNTVLCPQIWKEWNGHTINNHVCVCYSCENATVTTLGNVLLSVQPVEWIEHVYYPPAMSCCLSNGRSWSWRRILRKASANEDLSSVISSSWACRRTSIMDVLSGNSALLSADTSSIKGSEWCITNEAPVGLTVKNLVQISLKNLCGLNHFVSLNVDLWLTSVTHKRMHKLKFRGYTTDANHCLATKHHGYVTDFQEVIKGKTRALEEGLVDSWSQD